MKDAASQDTRSTIFHTAHIQEAHIQEAHIQEAHIQEAHIQEAPIQENQAVNDPDPVLRKLDDSVTRLNQVMAQLDSECSAVGADMDRLAAKLTEQIRETEEVAREVEGEFKGDSRSLRRAQAEFRCQTDPSFSKSYFMHRARTWPRGYPGDYRIIDQAYDKQVLSEGLGGLLDRYFLGTTLAVAIRWRREKMREILAAEMAMRQNAQVLNIGCGPCREVLELAPEIARTGARFTCLDFDDEALAYSADRLADTAAGQQVEFRRYNALRMVNARRNLQTFGAQDVIYTIGLLDYLTDDVLVRMIGALHATLKPGGVFIAVFKDCERYDTQDYHWLVDWSGFHQRTAQESRRLVELAGVEPTAVTTQRTRCGVMVFYRIERSAVTVAGTPHSSHGKVRQTSRNRRVSN